METGKIKYPSFPLLDGQLQGTFYPCQQSGEVLPAERMCLVRDTQHLFMAGCEAEAGVVAHSLSLPIFLHLISPYFPSLYHSGLAPFQQSISSLVPASVLLFQMTWAKAVVNKSGNSLILLFKVYWVATECWAFAHFWDIMMGTVWPLPLSNSEFSLEEYTWDKKKLPN